MFGISINIKNSTDNANNIQNKYIVSIYKGLKYDKLIVEFETDPITNPLEIPELEVIAKAGIRKGYDPNYYVYLDAIYNLPTDEICSQNETNKKHIKTIIGLDAVIEYLSKENNSGKKLSRKAKRKEDKKYYTKESNESGNYQNKYNGLILIKPKSSQCNGSTIDKYYETEYLGLLISKLNQLYPNKIVASISNCTGEYHTLELLKPNKTTFKFVSQYANIQLSSLIKKQWDYKTIIEEQEKDNGFLEHKIFNYNY